MAKIIRFSGYFVDADSITYDAKCFEENLLDWISDEISTECERYALHQFHAEESEKFDKIDGELEENCDLALLTRHFKKDTPTEFDRPLPKAGEKYRHFKIGKIVTVIAIARHTETNELTVVYDCGENGIFNRPLDMFMSETEREKYPDAEQKYRFEKVDDFDSIDNYEGRKELEENVKPLHDWICKYGHPHMKVEVTMDHVEVLEGTIASELNVPD